MDVLFLGDWPGRASVADEVKVAMHAASANPVDGKLRGGFWENVTGPIKWPAGCGRDGAGEIVAIGENVDPAWLGRRVCFLAPWSVPTWADEAVVPVAIVAALPDTVTFAQAAAVPLVGLSALRGLVDVAKVKKGQRVLIHAASGGVGHIAVQLAKHLGAEAIGTCSAKNRDFVLGLGASQVIAYDEDNMIHSASKVDVVFDLIGGAAHVTAPDLLREGGRLVYLNTGPVDVPDMPDGTERLEATIEPDGALLTKIVDLMAQGAITPYVLQVFPLKDYEQVQIRVDAAHVRGKVVLEI
ncbi:MAG: NADP-dependent oxidoreductase [Pseudomonadota bacterium]